MTAQVELLLDQPRAHERSHDAREQLQRERDAALEQVARHAGELFRERARVFVVAYLTANGATSGEEISLACKAAGIKPHDDRAFGPVYFALCREGKIEKCGQVRRTRGHGTAGGNVWRVTGNV